MKKGLNYILLSKNQGVAVLSLNRPPANSYFLDSLKELSTTINKINEDKAIKVILINSTSEKFFCAGADIKIFSSNTTEQNTEMVNAARAVNTAIVSSTKIVIASIKGHILGGGLELAMACDIRLASKGEYLVGLPEVKLGLMPGNGGTPRLIDLIGASRAMELLITGNNMSPEKAHEYGLFNQLYNKEDFESEVEAYVSHIASGPGEAMSAIKKYVQMHKGITLKKSLDLETKLVNTLYNTPDAKEGFLAFVEKRKPKYK